MSSPSDAFPDPNFRPSIADFTLNPADYDLMAGNPNIHDGTMRRGNWNSWRTLVKLAKFMALLMAVALMVFGQNLSLQTLQLIIGVVVYGALATIVISVLGMFSRRYVMRRSINLAAITIVAVLAIWALS